MENLKLVVVGDGAVGKTCLLTRYGSKFFPEDYVPTVFESWVSAVTVNDLVFSVGLWDTAAESEHARLRPLSYPHTDVFIVCFSIVSRPSFRSVKDLWVPEIQHHCPDVPFVLCGTKTDLRDDADTLARLAARGQSMVSEEEGREMAELVGARAFLQCSALTGDGVVAVFHTAIRESQNIAVTKSSARACALL